jgi:hypothetical protein
MAVYPFAFEFLLTTMRRSSYHRAQAARLMCVVVWLTTVPTLADGLVLTSLGSAQLLNDFSLERNSGYQQVSKWLLDSGNTILPGTTILGQQPMHEVDLFYAGVSKDDESFKLSDESQSLLYGFVHGGGTLMIEADSDIDQRTSANRLLNIFGYGTACW